MRVLVTGQVVEVEHRAYTRADGSGGQTFDAYLASDNPRFGASRISGPAELAPVNGARVAYWANITARPGKDGRAPWLSVWCVDLATPVLDALEGARA